MCVYRCDFFICYFVVAVMRSVIRYLQCYGIVRCFLLSLQIVSSTILLILLCITNFRRVSCFLDLVTKRGHGVQLFALLAGSSRTTISLLPFALTSSPLHHPSVPPSIPKKNKYTHTHTHLTTVAFPPWSGFNPRPVAPLHGRQTCNRCVRRKPTHLFRRPNGRWSRAPAAASAAP